MMGGKGARKVGEREGEEGKKEGLSPLRHDEDTMPALAIPSSDLFSTREKSTSSCLRHNYSGFLVICSQT